MSDTPLNIVLQTLHQHGSPAQQKTGYWLARCPAHDDSNPSLSISEGDQGQVLLKCHAGCGTEDIVSALGLSMGDLFPKDTPPPARKKQQNPKQQPKIVKEYNYQDENGELLYQVVRYKPKGFKQRRPNPERHGKWIWSLDDVVRVPYRLPELLASDLAIIVEGEKDADRLAHAGFTGATTFPMGAGNWRPEYTQHFTGKDVVILPDADTSGKEHGSKVAGNLHGVAKRVRLLEPFSNAKDVSDWLDSGGTVEQLRKLMDICPTYSPENPPEWAVGTKKEPSSTPTFNIPKLEEALKTNEVGNAELLVKRHKHELRFEPNLNRWYRWTGRQWKQTPKIAIKGLAREVIMQELPTEVKQAGNDLDRFQTCLRHFQVSARDKQFDAMVRIAESYSELWVDASDFDAEPWLFNVQNGVLDLRTGELLPHSSDRLIMKIAPVTWQGLEVTSALWESFLERLCGSENGSSEDSVERLKDYLQSVAGYLLFGGNPAEKFFLIHGPKRSGKSTFLAALFSAMGDAKLDGYANASNAETFLQSGDRGDGSKPRSDLMAFMGARFVFASEFPEYRRFDSAKMKMWSGGDPITARAPYNKCETTFKPMFTIAIATNDLPTLERTDAALWDRAIPLPFPYSIPEGQRDPNVKEALSDPEQHGAAILAWAVRGLLVYRDNGNQLPSLPPEVLRSKEDLFAEQDPLREFIEECCELQHDAWVSRTLLRRAYVDYASEVGDHPIGNRKFSDLILARDDITRTQKRDGDKRVWGYEGIRLARDVTQNIVKLKEVA